MKRIIYIHGFGSCGLGNKSRAIKNHFDIKTLTPDLPPSPKNTLNLLAGLITPRTILIGSSLGGYYAIYLAEKFSLKAVLINPSLKPYKTLRDYTGTQYRFCDNKAFEWKKEYLKELKKYKIKPKKGKYLVLLQSGDEVLNYKKTLKKFKNRSNAKVIVEQGGNHRFENISDYLCMIENFINA
ncbi:YqiA/YcfP family alpha/beta fold hydrolase [Nautilia sp.]